MMTDKEAMKLALEALENSVDLVREDAYQAEKLYGNYPARQGKVNGLKVLADDHEKAIIALQKALANEALDKMAENARALGLDYEPVGEAYLCDKCQTPFDGAWECPNCGHRSATKESVYTTPPAAQRQWVGLTDDELADIWYKQSLDWMEFARAIEAAHGIKEKNT